MAFEATRAAYVESEAWQADQNLWKRINDAAIPVWGGTHNRIAIALSEAWKPFKMTGAMIAGNTKDYSHQDDLTPHHELPEDIKDSQWGKDLLQARNTEIAAAALRADGYVALAELNITSGLRQLEAADHAEAIVPHRYLPLEASHTTCERV